MAARFKTDIPDLVDLDLQQGEVLESFVTKTQDKAAALKFIRKAIKRHGSSAQIESRLD